MEFKNISLEAIAHVVPPEPLTSDAIEEQLRPVYERLRLPAGRLELMTGIRSRHFWPRGTKPSAASAEAGRAVLAKSRISAEEIDLLIHAAVCRDQLEPATATTVHSLIGLPQRTQVFDISNACLGFLNALSVAAAMVDSGQIRTALICSGENGRPLIEHTIQTLLDDDDLTRKSIKPYFANLTIGAGAVAAVVTHKDLAPATAPRLLGGIAQTDTSYNALCQGDSSGADSLVMQTDSEALLEAGLTVASRTWERFIKAAGWTADTPDHVITHQVGKAHQKGLFDRLGLNLAKDYTSYETMGNVGSVSLPLTLSMALEEGIILPGQRAALLGIGSGLCSIMLALEMPTR